MRMKTDGDPFQSAFTCGPKNCSNSRCQWPPWPLLPSIWLRISPPGQVVLWTFTYVAPLRIALISSSISPVLRPWFLAARVAGMFGLTSAATIVPEIVAGGAGHG